MSRPRKRVLIFSALDLGSTPVVFVLDTRGMRARSMRTPEEFVEQLDAFAPDAALVYFDGGSASEAARRCEEAAFGRDLPVLLAVRTKVRTEPRYATFILQREQVSMMEVYEALRRLTARKRGPKKTDGMNTYRAIVAGRTAAAASARLA